MAFFDPLVEDLPPRRTWDDEDYYWDIPASESPPEPIIVVNKNASPPVHDGVFRPKLLLMAVGQPGIYLCHGLCSQKAIVGSVVLPEIDHAGNCFEPSPGDKSCHMYGVPSPDGCAWEAVIVPCQYLISPDRARAVAIALLDHVQAQWVLVLGSMLAGNFRGLPETEDGTPAMFAVETDACKKRRFASSKGATRPPSLGPGGLPFLPPGNVVDGISAAMLTQAQFRQVPCALITAIQSMPTADVNAVRPLARSIQEFCENDAQLSSLPGMNGAVASSEQRLNADEAEFASRNVYT
eukprot:jgi/Mesvir1/19089/Mv12841-RA.1